MLRRPIKKLAALLDQKLLLIGPRSLVPDSSPSAVPSETLDFSTIVNLAFGCSESLLWSSHPAVQEITRLVNCADLACPGIGIGDEDVAALLRHLSARRTNQKRGRMGMSPMDAGSATQREHLALVVRAQIEQAPAVLPKHTVPAR